MRRSAAALVIVSLHGFSAGCHRGAASERRHDLPPYRLEEGTNRLVVREDLVSKIETKSATTSAVAAMLVGYGRLTFAADASYAVRVPYPSFVEKVLVARGDTVKPGRPLAELRSSDVAHLRTEVANSEVAVATERQAAERLQRLVADGTANEREVAEARARLMTAESQLAGARSSLEATSIDLGSGDRYLLRASAAGRVLSRTIDPGERVAPEDPQPALVIGDPARLVVQAQFPERDGVWLQEGEPCRFTVNAVAGDPFSGTIAHVASAVDRRTGAAEATCRPSQQDARLSSEMGVRVEVSIRRAARVVVPRGAVLLGNDQYLVLVRVAPTIVERREVEIGQSIGDHIQILKGVVDGEQVVTRGAVLLDGELDQLL